MPMIIMAISNISISNEISMANEIWNENQYQLMKMAYKWK